MDCFNGTVDQILAQEDMTKSLAADDRVLYLLTDHLGSVRDIVDNTGTAVGHFSYDAFGNLVGPGLVLLTRYLWTGREYDIATGLQYNRNRWYDPTLGRWVSEDPIGFGGGDVNLYGYTGNQPAIRTDPSGLDWLDTAANFNAGLGDTMSLGLGWVVRDLIFGINTVDYDSGGYYWGGWAGVGVDVCAGGFVLKGGLKSAGRVAAREAGEAVGREAAELAAREAAELAAKEFAEQLGKKSLTELKQYTRGLPWEDLWGHGIDGARAALRRIRSGESICPNSIKRQAIEAYDEIAKRVLADPNKSTETGRALQELRRQIIEELRRSGM